MQFNAPTRRLWRSLHPRLGINAIIEISKPKYVRRHGLVSSYSIQQNANDWCCSWRQFQKRVTLWPAQSCMCKKFGDYQSHMLSSGVLPRPARSFITACYFWHFSGLINALINALNKADSFGPAEFEWIAFDLCSRVGHSQKCDDTTKLFTFSSWIVLYEQNKFFSCKDETKIKLWAPASLMTF